MDEDSAQSLLVERRDDDSGDETDIEEYSLIRFIPWFFALAVRSILHLPSFIIKISYRIIQTVGETWLVATYVLLLVLRGIGRLVIFSPFYVLTFIAHIVQTLGRLLFKQNRSKNGKLSWLEIKREIIFSDIKRKIQDRKRHYIWARSRYAWQLAFSSAGLCVVLGLTGFFYVEILTDMPNPFTLRKIELTASSRIMDREGRLLYNVYQGENRTLVSLNELPAYVPLATIAIEDVDFYKHNGISLRGMLRAAKTNFLDKKGEGFQGGSTITQQLVKNLLLSPERTWKRKLKEIILAMAMEAHFNKEEILRMYLNEVAFGGPQFGIEAASQYYFGKSAKYLTLAEATVLAGLPSQPSRNSPFVDPEAARNRQLLVLKRMIDNHFLTPEEANKAKEEKLVYVPQAIPIKAPHFVMMVRQALIDRFGEKVVNQGGLQVYTTLDLPIQTMAERAVRDNISRIKLSHHVNNGASLVTQPQSGEILAMVGSVDYFDPTNDGQVNIVTSARQPGSSIKPVNYAYTFEHLGMHPGSVLMDAPVVYQVPGSEPYAPVNYDGTFKGPMTIRQALGQSRNVPAVNALVKYGPLKMAELGRAMGITTWQESKYFGLSMTLGSREVTILDMATVYGTFDNMGVRHDPVLIRKVTDAYGNVLVDNTVKESKTFFSGILKPVEAKDNSPLAEGVQKGKRVLSKVTAYWITNILADYKAKLPAFGPYAKLEVPGHTVAVKTGTTNDFRDNWTIGYTPDYVVATWVGNTNNEPMNKNLVSGITGAAPMWNEIMTNLIKNLPDRVWAAPEDMVAVKICATNGLLTCPYCPQTTTEYFKKGSEPTQACNFESPNACAAKRAQAEAEHKSPEEIAALTANCTVPAPTKNP